MAVTAAGYQPETETVSYADDSSHLEEILEERKQMQEAEEARKAEAKKAEEEARRAEQAKKKEQQRQQEQQRVRQTAATQQVSLGEAERITRDFYLSNGFTKTATAYLMGTIRAESGFQPNGQCGDGGLACGIFQWHPPRRASGLPNTLEGQLQYSVREMDTDSPGLRETLQTSNDPNTVASAIKGWIRYGHAGNRYVYAQQYLNKL